MQEKKRAQDIFNQFFSLISMILSGLQLIISGLICLVIFAFIYACAQVGKELNKEQNTSYYQKEGR